MLHRNQHGGRADADEQHHVEQQRAEIAGGADGGEDQDEQRGARAGAPGDRHLRALVPCKHAHDEAQAERHRGDAEGDEDGLRPDGLQPVSGEKAADRFQRQSRHGCEGARGGGGVAIERPLAHQNTPQNPSAPLETLLMRIIEITPEIEPREMRQATNDRCRKTR